MPQMKDKSGRVYLREVSSETYSLSTEREKRLARPRVRRSTNAETGLHLPLSPDDSTSEAWWALSPADDKFLTQSLEVHFRELPPGEANTTHGHQNEALFYWLEGNGHDDHDGERFPWSGGDVVFVPVDTVHRHVNDSSTERAVAVVVKAKSLWMYLGLFAQGPVAPWGDDEAIGFGPRVDWPRLWTTGLAEGATVVHAGLQPWSVTEAGLVRDITSRAHSDHRNSSVDLYAQRIAGGGRSSRHLHMADEVMYILSGSGFVRQWEVRAEIADRYYARIAEDYSDWTFGPGDLVYVPPSTAHQIVATQGSEVELLCAHNRAFSYLGYDGTLTLEQASEVKSASR